MKTARQYAEEPPDDGSCRTASPAAPAFHTVSHPNSLNQAIAKRDRSRFRVSERSREFLAKYYPDATLDDWCDWRWQNRHRVRTLADLERMILLSQDEAAAIRRHTGALPVGITPYYASLLSRNDPEQPLRRTVVPVLGEYEVARGENEDPLGEDAHSPVPGLVHRYPDRVLLLVTNFCSVYCRYCTRARMVGSVGERSVKKTDIEAAIEYIERTPAVRDVLISGGDPLSLDDDRLLERSAAGYLRRLMEHLDYVGVLTLELFDTDAGLLANEFAPRVHNSGHWTIEGAATSQFESHLRAVLGLPLGDTGPVGHAAMINLIGEIPAERARLESAGFRLHDYGKISRPGRKLGHLTTVAGSAAERDRRLSDALKIIENRADRRIPAPRPGNRDRSI